MTSPHPGGRPTQPTRRRLRVITWNAKVGRNGKKVRRAVRLMAARRRASVVLLQEARGYRDELAKLTGWDLYASKGRSSEAGQCVTLVRQPLAERLHRRAMTVLRMKREWRGPKRGKHHDGRQFLELDLGWLTLVNVHRTRPGWSDRGRAFREEYNALVESAHRAEKAGKAWATGGDQNIGTRPRDKRMRYSPWQLAKAIGGRVITTARGHIDYLVGRGVTGKAKRIGKHGSDHRAVLLKIRESH